MLTLGIDIGSTSSKAILLKDGHTVLFQQVIPGGTGSSGPQRVLDAIFTQAGLSWNDLDNSVVTGYGRFSLDEVKNQVSEITCHAKGIAFLVPTAHTILDIGGQDVKAISLDNKGLIHNFFMNDKCAAGTGRFLEVMANVLELTLDDMSELHFQSQQPAQVSSTCTVFAESEVISLLSKGALKADVVAGIHYSTAIKAVSLAKRVGIQDDIVICGGVSANKGVVDAISKELKKTIIVAPLAQLSGAFGAALIAAEEVRKRQNSLLNKN